jgi:hypothetical protein
MYSTIITEALDLFAAAQLDTRKSSRPRCPLRDRILLLVCPPNMSVQSQSIAKLLRGIDDEHMAYPVSDSVLGFSSVWGGVKG